METAVGACNGVRYSVDVRYWECPLIESPQSTNGVYIYITCVHCNVQMYMYKGIHKI